MRKFQCLLFLLKQSYICYYIICMTVPLIQIIYKGFENKILEDNIEMMEQFLFLQ